MSDLPSDYDLWQQSEFRALAGGSYFNPTAELISVGRRLIAPDTLDHHSMNITNTGERTFLISELFNVLASQLRPEELMFGLYDRVSHQLAPLLTNAIDLMAYECQVTVGYLACICYYAVPNEVADGGLARAFGEFNL
jgi:hypothetical protein